MSAQGTPFVSANAVLYYVLTYGLTTVGAFGVVDVLQRKPGATGSTKASGWTGWAACWPRLVSVGSYSP